MWLHAAASECQLHLFLHAFLATPKDSVAALFCWAIILLKDSIEAQRGPPALHRSNDEQTQGGPFRDQSCETGRQSLGFNIRCWCY